MSLRGVIIKEGTVGRNVSGDSRQFALVCNGEAVGGKAELDKPYKLSRVADAEALGITQEYDTANDVRIYRHITEFYRKSGEGRPLWLVLCARAKKPEEMTDAAKMAVIESGGSISDIAFAYNPAEDYSDTVVDGMNADVKAAIIPLQRFAEWCDKHDMPLHVILEGRAIGDSLTGLADLRGLEASEGVTFHGEKVTVVIGQDWNYAEALASNLGKKYADVGTFLGCIAAQAWNRNPGEVATMRLTDGTRGDWLVGGLSNHKPYSEVFDNLESLDDKGYVFPIRYQGMDGCWWNDGHTCTPIIVDKDGNMNQHTLYYSHTMDECKRALRAAFLPELKGVVPVENGKLPKGVIAYFNSVGDNALSRLSPKISAWSVQADENSDVLVDKELRISFAVVPTGSVNTITGTINLKNRLP